MYIISVQSGIGAIIQQRVGRANVPYAVRKNRVPLKFVEVGRPSRIHDKSIVVWAHVTSSCLLVSFEPEEGREGVMRILTWGNWIQPC